MLKTAPKTEEVICHVCKTLTAHKVVFTNKVSRPCERYDDRPDEMTGIHSVVSSALMCQGCRALCVKRVEEDSNMDYADVQFFPPRPNVTSDLMKQAPSWTEKLPDGIDDLLREVYEAGSVKCYRLAAMGVRALVEEVMNIRVSDIGGFDQKMDQMVKVGDLSSVQRAVLEPTVELGHAAIHRGHKPDRAQLVAALGVVEGLLELFFVQEKVVATLTKNVKPRVKPKKVKKTGQNQPQAKQQTPMVGVSEQAK